MKLSVCQEDKVVELDVYEDMDLETLTAYCEAELGVSFQQGNLIMLHHAKPLMEKTKTLKELNIADGDMILVVSKEMLASGLSLADRMRQTEANPTPASGSQLGPLASMPTAGGSTSGREFADVTLEHASKVRDSFLANPELVSNLKIVNMPLSDALASGSLELFHKVLNDQQKAKKQDDMRRIRMLTADPFDVEAQRMIAEEIQRQQIDSNMQDAIEFMPEAFGSVHMLYIKCKVNGYDIDAFVDSGAQSTIMSKACAERCNIIRLIDERWSGIAQGVGTQKILGRIHMCQIQIENDFFGSSFSVLEQQPMDMLLGLDMLKRHQCVIDLKHNILRIGTTGTETKFLSEAELPTHAKTNHAATSAEQ